MSDESGKMGHAAVYGEPWRVSRGEYMDSVVKDSGKPVYNQVDTKRVLACVNALAGIEDPAAYLEELREKARKYEELCK